MKTITTTLTALLLFMTSMVSAQNEITLGIGEPAPMKNQRVVG